MTLNGWFLRYVKLVTVYVPKYIRVLVYYVEVEHLRRQCLKDLYSI